MGPDAFSGISPAPVGAFAFSGIGWAVTSPVGGLARIERYRQPPA